MDCPICHASIEAPPGNSARERAAQWEAVMQHMHREHKVTERLAWIVKMLRERGDVASQDFADILEGRRRKH